jgi:hypothetical protein
MQEKEKNIESNERICASTVCPQILCRIYGNGPFGACFSNFFRRSDEVFETALRPGRGDVRVGMEHGGVVFPFCCVAVEAPSLADFADLHALKDVGVGAGGVVAGCVLRVCVLRRLHGRVFVGGFWHIGDL